MASCKRWGFLSYLPGGSRDWRSTSAIMNLWNEIRISNKAEFSQTLITLTVAKIYCRLAGPLVIWQGTKLPMMPSYPVDIGITWPCIAKQYSCSSAE